VASKTERVVVTISIDTECDHDVNWARANPITFDSINEGLPNRLQPVYDAVGAVPTYLLTVEVLEDEECVKTLRSLQGNFEYGTHLHAAFIEPQKKYFDYAGVACPEFQCNYPEDIEFQKLENLSNLFTEKLGYRPTSFRAGRYGASVCSLRSLEKLGYCVDTSVTPRIKWAEQAGDVDFRSAPMQPYTPSDNDIVRAVEPGSRRILEAPVTVQPRFLRRTPRWFRPWFADLDQMKAVAHYHLNKFSHEPVVNLNMMFHSMEIIEKASPYPQTAADVDLFLTSMHDVLAWCRDEGFEFAGLSDLYKLYTPAG
jgi:hypothetical protein